MYICIDLDSVILKLDMPSSKRYSALKPSQNRVDFDSDNRKPQQPRFQRPLRAINLGNNLPPVAASETIELSHSSDDI